MKEPNNWLKDIGIIPKEKKAKTWMLFWILMATISLFINTSPNANTSGADEINAYKNCILKSINDRPSSIFFAFFIDGKRAKAEEDSYDCKLDLKDESIAFKELDTSSPIFSDDFELDFKEILNPEALNKLLDSQIREVDY
jgi:hypothetical protein